MSQTYYAILTAVGEAKLANAAALGIPLELTHMAVGAGNGATPQPSRTQTALVHENRRAPLNRLFVDPSNASQIIAEQIIPENIGGWWIREIGLYDEDGNLCAVANCPDTYKPVLSSGSGRTQIIRMVLIVANTSAVELKVDPSVVLAPRGYVDQVMESHTDAADPHAQYLLRTKAEESGLTGFSPDNPYPVGAIGQAVSCLFSAPSDRYRLSKKPFVLVIAGQSNAAGANAGGANPANPLVQTWDGVTGTWSGSDYTARPWTRSNPDGNLGNNNIGLALAHRIADETGRPVRIIFHAQGGSPISEWKGAGTASLHYAALKAKVEAALASAEMVAAGITKVDAILWMQGEADYLNSFDQHLSDLQALVSQWRAEAWCQKSTPILMGEMSDLHDRYEPKKAIRWLGGGIDPWIASVNSKGLETSDNTHFVGADLWEFGYHRFYRALQTVPRSWHVPRTLWRNRDGIANAMPGADPKYGETVIYSPSSLALSGADRTPTYPGTIACGPSVSQGASNGIAVGSSLTVTASGSGVFGVGSTVSDINCLVGGYGQTVAGRNSLVAGYQNTILAAAQYAAAIGRGHAVADPYCVALGGFSEFTTARADPAVLQVGVSVSSATPKNGLTVFRSGRTMLGGLLDFKNDNAYSLGSPGYRASVVYAGTSTISTSDGRLKRKRGGLSDAELRAWEKVQPCVYQMLDAIEEKGESGARLHAGLIAQEVMEAFVSEGLDPARYALFCEDEIFEEVIEYQTRPVERQMMTTRLVPEIEIIDGRPVQVQREVQVPEFVELEVVDESGVLVLDGDGEPLKYRMPVTETVDEQVPVPVRRSLGTRYGLRYSECLVFEAAYLRTVVSEIQSKIA